MHRNRSVDLHQFAMIPRADIPRSSFMMNKTLKSTFDAGLLVPVFCEEVLPGDMFKLKMTAFARLATPLFPTMDNQYLESFWFFVPNRLVWDNWKKFMGEQANPGDSIAFTIPKCSSPVGGYAINGLHDYFGLPTVGQVMAGGNVTHSNLPLRMYNLIWNEWFRDENLQNSVTVDRGDGPDTAGNYTILKRGKRHDYFTSCLPFTQKGTAMGIPLGISAPVKTSATATFTGVQPALTMRADSSVLAGAVNDKLGITANTATDSKIGTFVLAGSTVSASGVYPSNLYADLSAATAATINQLRQAFQIQKLLERDARGGTRYTEIIRAHFGVISPDARLQRPEYLGGCSTRININPVAQTSATGMTGGTTPQGNLTAIGTGLMQCGFTQSFTEHGYVICLVNVRNDLTYQQGQRAHWNRTTRYDFYFPAFAMLGEQPVYNLEIYARGSADGVNDLGVFGYQERWAEYRYLQNEITGLFRSTAAQTIDPWHYAEKFTTRPALNATFIQDPAKATTERSIAVGSAAGGQQFLFDAFYEVMAARPMPLYSVPGMIDHF